MEENIKQMNVKKLGKKQKEILEYLRQHGGSLWQEDIVNKFAYSAKYQNYVLTRLHRLEERGLIIMRQELNPNTGRMKKRVYLVQ